jgi:PAS domain S-box-containing protein
MASWSRRVPLQIAGVFRHSLNLLPWIVEPPAGVGEKQRRHLSLLSAFLLLIAIETLIGMMVMKNAGNSTWVIMLGTATILVLGYVLSRTTHYRLATVIAVSIPAVPIIAMILFSPNREDIPNQLPWLALPVLVCSLLLPLRHTVIIAICYVSLIVLLTPFMNLPIGRIAESLAFMFMIIFFVVAVTAARQREQTEIEHQLAVRQQAEKALRESEEKFSKAFHASPDSISIIRTKDGVIIEANDSFLRFTGFSREELIGHRSSEFKTWADEEERQMVLARIKKQGGVRNEEVRLLTRSGEVKTCLLSADYISIGGERCLISVATDITERQRAERLQQDENYVLTLLGQGAELGELLDAIVRLGESHDPAIKGSVMLFDAPKQTLFQAAAPNLPESYLKLLANGLPIGPNVGSCGTAAYRKERVIVPDIANSPLFKPYQEAIEQAIINRLLACYSEPIIASSGELLGTIANYSSKTGNPSANNLRVLEWSARIAAIAIERRQAEEALANEAIRRRILIEQSRDGIVVLDKDGKVYESNQQFAKMLGYSLEETLQLSVWDWEYLYPPEQTLEMIRSVDETGDHFETQHRRKDGTIYDVEISTNGAVFGGEKLIFCVCRDITGRKRAQERLNQTMLELEQSSNRLAATNRELETFSYSVSHDLRSPLRSIDGFSQALLEDYSDKLDEKGRDYLGRLRGASQKMGELIDGLLKLSRLTRAEMHEEPVDLSALAEEIAAELQETQPRHRVKFIIAKQLTARGDTQLLRVLLENLLGNAWKFTGKTPHARIEFGATRNNGRKTYFVKDNGVGFDMTYVDRLFGAFQRLHDSNEFPGTGIGLATVRRIINRHGGTIRAEGAPGKGATFYFTLD